MNHSRILSFVKTVAVAIGVCLFAMLSPIVIAQEKVNFENQVKPFFEKYCYECHQGEDADSFRIDNDELMSYVVAGDPDSSELYTYMLLDEDDDLLMPPIDHQPRPNGQEMMLVKTWIQQGAPMAMASAQTGVAAADDAPATDQPAAAPVAPVRKPSKFEAHIYNALGSLHPAAVHLPIGLLLAAGLFALLSLRGSFVMSDCAYYCLWLGMFGAIFACVSGWWYSPMEHRGTVTEFNDLFDQTQKVFWHRTGGLIVTIVAALVCLIAKRTRDTNPDDGTLWKLGAIVLAGGIGWVGHEGGELTYGKGHYKDLDAVVEFLTEEMTGQAPKPKVDRPEIEEEAPATGETSTPEIQEPFSANDI